MTRPRFSIALPTRNRPALLKVAIETILRQTFKDWELVLSDNSTNEDTRELMRTFNDPRIRYLRANNLSMCDNWEFVCQHAEGEYVCVLEDKQALKFDALERIDEVTRRESPEILRWQWDSLEPYGLGHRVRRHGKRGGTRRTSSDEALSLLVDGTYMDAKYGLPIAHYSCFHRELLERIRAGAIGRLFPLVSPDYTLAMQALNFSDEIVYLDEGLVAFTDVSVSNGLSFSKKTDLSKEFTKSIGGAHMHWECVPIKAAIIPGSIYNDYVRNRAKLGGRMERHPPNWVSYYVSCFEEVCNSLALGVPMEPELAECERALAAESDDLRAAVEARIARQDRRRSSWMRRLRKSPPVQGFSRGTKSWVHGRLLRRPDWRHDHILQYLEQEAGK